MSESTFDVCVIGSGPGGYVAAIRARQLGLSAVCVEKERLGGVCLNWGCIPSKALLKAAEQYAWLKEGTEAFGISVDNVRHDYAKVIARSRKIADQSERGVQFLFKKYGVTSVKGTARIVGPGRVQVGDDTILAKHVIVATGSRPRVFPGIELDGERVVTYREAITGTVQPESVIVLGSGAIGCEFAYFWASFGSKVTIVELAPRICPVEDADISAELARSFKKQGIELRTGVGCTSAKRDGDGVKVVLSDGTELRASHCLAAIGIAPVTEGLGLETVGIELEKGWIKHDASFRTTAAGFYAIGDVSGPPALAHTAYAEAHVCVERIAGHAIPDVDYGNMPAATYCQPQLASVGLTEEKAKAMGLEYSVGKFPYSANGKARAIGHTEGVVKVILGKKYGEILGAHLCGPDASEQLANFVMARSAEVTGEHFLHVVHAHPTLGEAMYEAVAVGLGKSTHI